jgi:hypothetical protein
VPPLRSATRHYHWSAALVERAVREARKASGPVAVAREVSFHQATAAFQASRAVSLMLAEQDIDDPPEALLNTSAFTTSPQSVAAMLDQVEVDQEFDRLVASLIQNAGRAAEQAATAVRSRVGYVRYLSPPSCSRCAVLAGRVYRYSDGFLRHPRCDCTMIPTSIANPAFTHDPVDLARRGLVTGMSKADMRAVDDGADFGRVVNVRLKTAGLGTPGRVLSRAGRPTPEAIYRSAASREDAIQALISAGYVR